MNDDIYSTPASNLEDNISSEEAFKLESNLKFTKTMIMNIIGGVCFFIKGIELYFDKTNPENSIPLLMFLTIICSVLCGSALGSAYALRAQAGSKFQLVMISINWLYIGIFIFSILAVIFLSQPSIDTRIIIFLMPAVFMFIIPQLINTNALKKIRIHRQKT